MKKEIKKSGISAVNGITRVLYTILRGAGNIFDLTAGVIHSDGRRHRRDLPSINDVRPKARVYNWKLDGEPHWPPMANHAIVKYEPTYRVFVSTSEVTKAATIVRRNTSAKYGRVSYSIVRIAAMTTEKQKHHQNNVIDSDGLHSEVNALIGNIDDSAGVTLETATALFMSEFAGIQATADPNAVLVEWSLDNTPFEFYDPMGASGIDPVDIACDLYWLAMEGKPDERRVAKAAYTAAEMNDTDCEIEGDAATYEYGLYSTQAFLDTLYAMSTGSLTYNNIFDLNPDWHQTVYGEMPIGDTYRCLQNIKEAIESGKRLTMADVDMILRLYHHRISDVKEGIVPGEILNRYRHLALAYADGDEKMLWASALYREHSSAAADHIAKFLTNLTPEEQAYMDSNDENATPVGRFAAPFVVKDSWKNPYDKYIPEELIGQMRYHLTAEGLYRAVGGTRPYTEPHACMAIVDLSMYGPAAVSGN